MSTRGIQSKTPHSRPSGSHIYILTLNMKAAAAAISTWGGRQRTGLAVRQFAAPVLIFLCLVFTSSAEQLNGYYQVTSLTIIQDGKPRGFNNTDIYIAATDRRIKIAGAWRGYPMMRYMAVERVIGDTLVLRDTQNPSSYYKFHVKNNIIIGRHALSYEDGTRSVMDAKAVVRKLNQGEADRVRAIFGW